MGDFPVNFGLLAMIPRVCVPRSTFIYSLNLRIALVVRSSNDEKMIFDKAFRRGPAPRWSSILDRICGGTRVSALPQ